MNDYATALKMTSSNFDSPHGLMNIQNQSTAYDMGRLAAKAMKSPIFRRIVGKKISSADLSGRLIPRRSYKTRVLT